LFGVAGCGAADAAGAAELLVGGFGNGGQVEFVVGFVSWVRFAVLAAR
jgi:hypothetical protein